MQVKGKDIKVVLQDVVMIEHFLLDCFLTKTTGISGKAVRLPVKYVKLSVMPENQIDFSSEKAIHFSLLPCSF